MVELLPLDLDPAALEQAVALLDRLHDDAAPPIGQSVMGGTQTRGGLFDRHEPILAAMQAAVLRTIERYRSGLPAFDPMHPLLRQRAQAWRVKGSWSVRLRSGGDRHATHIHPQGIVSSAMYLRLPADGNSDAGALELGRPPTDLRLDLPPTRTILPRIGHCALFPSTAYHGTTSFGAGDRLTVAFDVQAT